MTMTREQVAALLDGTTPGPWVKTSADHPEQGVFGMGYRLARMTGGEIQRDTANASLMTAAPDLARQLLAAMDRLADADMAQTALVERAAEAADCGCKADKSDCLFMSGDVTFCYREGLPDIRRLAPDAGVQALAALKAERDELSDKLALERALTDGAHRRAKEAEADNARLATALAEAEAQVAEAYALGFEASAEGWNGEYPTADFRNDPVWQLHRDKNLAAASFTPAEQQLFDKSMAMRDVAGKIAKEQME